MSLLLDALKQAEQSKKQQQAGGQDKAEAGIQELSVEQREASNETADEMPSEQWTELDVLPDLDLTVVTDEAEPSEKRPVKPDSELSNQPLSDLQNETVNDEPEQPMAIEAMEATAESAPEELTPPDRSEDVMAAETVPDNTEERQAETEQADEKTEPATAAQSEQTQESVVRPEDMDAARAILQGNRPKKQYKSYAVLFIVLLLLAAAGSYFLFFSNQTSQRFENYPPVDDMMMPGDMAQMEEGSMAETMAADSEMPVAESLSDTPGNDEVATQRPARQEILPPEKPVPARRDNAIDSPMTSKSQPRFQSLEAESPIKITIKSPSPRLNQDLAEAYAAFQRHDYRVAEQLYRRVVRRDPKQVDAWLGLAAIAEKQGQVRMAKSLYQRVLHIDAQQTYAQQALIRLQNRQSPAEQEALYRQLAEKYPDNAQAQASLARFYVAHRRWQQAQAAYFKAVALAPENALYSYNLAVCLDHLGKSEAALRYYQKTVLLSTHKPQAGIDLARVKQRIQQLQGA